MHQTFSPERHDEGSAVAADWQNVPTGHRAHDDDCPSDEYFPGMHASHLGVAGFSAREYPAMLDTGNEKLAPIVRTFPVATSILLIPLCMVWVA